MTVEQTVDRLVQEVDDLLGVSSVGLYEFLEFLNTWDPSMPADTKAAIARQTLERVLAEDGVVMYRMRWPESGNQGDVSLSDLPSDAWDTPSKNGWYIAVDRR